jgi:putative ABC transport system permease protein
MKVRPILFLLISGVLLMLPFFLLPIAYALIVAVALLVILILVDASSNRILFRMSIRNIVRRPGTTALVVGGLMVGTAIISASFVVGDTMDNMITDQVTKGMGFVDFELQANNVGTPVFYNSSEIAPLTSNLSLTQHVRAVDTLILTSVSIRDARTLLFSPSVTLLGVDSKLVSDFGGLVDKNGNTINEVPAAGRVILNDKAAVDMNAQEGDQVMVFYQGTPMILTVDKIVKASQFGGFNSKANVFMNLTAVQGLTAEPDKVNTVLVSIEPKGSDPFGHSVQVRNDITGTIADTMPGSAMKIELDKKEMLDSGRSNLSQFTSMFFVLGSFSVIAGMLLIVNIFTMLGEERKSEMGMSRAIGMKKTHLRKLFVYEGLVYACVAAAVGMLVGVLMADLIILGISGMPMFGDTNLSNYFTFSFFSLAISFAAGFMITIVTVYFVTRRISNLNIVRAIRNIPEPAVRKEDKKAFRMGVALFVGGLLLMILGMQYSSLAPAAGGLSIMGISMGLLLRRFIGDRPAWVIAGASVLFVWLPKGDFKIFSYPSGIEMLIVSGLFMIVACLLIVMFNSKLFVSFFTAIFRFKNGYRAVIKTSISYPLKAHFRTGISIFIFAIVIFTITALSMMTGMLGVGINKMVNETSGGFDVIGFSMSPVTYDPWEHVNSTAGPLAKENISVLEALPTTNVMVQYLKTYPNGTVEPKTFTYTVVGVKGSFNHLGNYPLTAWNSTLYPSENDVWAAVQQDSSLVILDGSKYPSSSSFGFGGNTPSTLNLGQQFAMISGDGIMKNVTVVGFMKQSNLNGVFMSESSFNDTYHPTGYSLFLVTFTSGLDVDHQAALFKQEFVAFGMQTIAIKTLAKQITGTIDSFMTLFQAFLSMGLVIGVSGLGIITIRSIHERRLEIGMMRAMGYTRRMVVMNFAIESAFISALGIAIGSALGIVVGYDIWNLFLKDMGMDFVIAWIPIVALGTAAFLATVLCVIPAARGASKVAPAEVLRFE